MSRTNVNAEDNPFKEQVGGDHYTNMGMQPFEFTFANGYDGIAHTIFKYIARHAAKGGAADLRKAAHCVRLRAVDLHKNPIGVPTGAIPLKMFVGKNPQLTPMDVNALLHLDYWLNHPEREGLAEDLVQTIAKLIISTYATAEQE